MVEMDNNSAVVPTIMAATFGLVCGSALHTTFDTWNDRNLDLEGRFRIYPMVLRKYGWMYAATAGITTGVTLLVENYRGKRDRMNGAAGGFAAGATVFAAAGRGIPVALQAGSAMALLSVAFDSGELLHEIMLQRKKPSTDA